ncbi:MAG TPA: hypothetical protein VNO81_00645, partial [Candidatus Nitrosotenuis sp.]|nr:hypothetical protein [Candidatus Nitrosotenuis sp.]
MDPITTLEKQIEMYRRMVEEHPEDTTVLFTYAEACLRRDRRLEALKAFQKLLETEPLPEARLSIAEIYLRQKLFSEAYKELLKLFELDPYHLEGHLLLWRLKAHEPVPPSLEEHLTYVPGRRQLQKAFTRLRLEKSQLEGEVEQYRRVAESGGSEPIHQYYLEQARRRLARVVEQIRLLEAWQEEAQEEAVLAGRPRPELVPPQVPEAP